MEFSGRGKKRCFTDTFKYGESGGLSGIRFSRLTTLVYADDSRTPVYTPGPRPSELLKKFIGKKEPEKLTRIDEIKRTLHGIQKPNFKIRSERNRVSSMKYINSCFD